MPLTTAPTAAQRMLRPLSPKEQLLFSIWRMQALETAPYMASLLFRFRVFNAPGLNTMACDAGMRLYLDMDYVAGRGDKWCADGLLHECMHIFGMHFKRGPQHGVSKDDQQQLRDWNLAGDAANNDDLIAMGCHTLATGEDMTPAVLREPNDLSAEHYYDVIRNRRKGKPSAENSDDSGDGTNGDELAAFDGCGSASGGQAAPCELPSDGGCQGQDGQAAEVGEVQAACEQAAVELVTHAEGKGRGTVPGAMVASAQSMLAKPAADWRKKVKARTSRAIATSGVGRSTHKKVNRRLRGVKVAGKRVIYPGTVRPVPSLVVIRDTSSSMGMAGDIPRVNAEIVNISNALGVRGQNLLVVDVDTQVHPAVPMRDAATLRKVAGRGGTDMCAGIDYVIESGLNPSAVLVLTDLGTPWPRVKPPWPVIIVGVGTADYLRHYESSIPRWAQYVRADLADLKS